MSKKIKYFLLILLISLSIYLFGVLLRKYQPAALCSIGGGKYYNPENHQCELDHLSNSTRRLFLVCALTGSKYYGSHESFLCPEISNADVCISSHGPGCEF